MRNRSVAGLAVLALAVACSSGGGGGGGGGGGNIAVLKCSYSGGLCLTLSAPAIAAAQQTALQNECTADGGTFGTGACSTANAVAGTCAVTEAAYLPTTPVSGMTMTATFYTSAYSATTAATECDAMGTWTPSGGGGGGGGGTNIVSAHCTNTGTCTTYAAFGEFTPAHQTALQTYCAGTGGTYATGACNTLSGGLVAGTCSVTSAAAKPPTGANVAVVNRVYLTSSYDATSAAAACGSIGTWISAGGGGGGGGGGGALPTTIHCASASTGACLSLSAPAFTAAQLTALEGECAADGGTSGTGFCSATNAVPGLCTVTQAAYLPTTPVSGMTATAVFYTPTYDATSAASQCGAMGTWLGSGGGGGGGGTQTVVSCALPNVFCTEIRANPVPASYESIFQAGCDSAQGTVWATAGCPTAGAVGGYCRFDLTVDLGTAAEQRDYYYDQVFTSATAQEDCESDPDATWVP